MAAPAPLDYEAERALADLIDRATAKRNADLDPALVGRIKRLCRGSDAAVAAAAAALLDRLRRPHSQTRLLALELAGELFARSATFRALLAAQFPRFLASTLGFRTQEPLPPPAEAAERLRRRALELVEAWQASHGARHPQIALGYAYLRDTLRFEFPEVDARRAAAAAAAAEAEARAQRLADERCRRLLSEWRAQADEHRALLREFDVAFALLEGGGDGGGSGAEQAEDGGVEWEDVAEEALPPEADAVEGLAAYAADERLEEAAAAAAQREDDSGAEAQLDSVVETLDGLYKLISNQALPWVQEALRAVVRAGDGGGEAAARERLLRAATQLRTDLAAAKARFEGSHLDLAALSQAQARRKAEREVARAEAGPAARPEPEKEEVHNPYHYIRDPTAPLVPFRAPGAGPSAPSPPPPRRKPPPPDRRPASASPTGSSLPESLRKSLAARAPVLPSALPFVRVWDSGTAVPPQYVSGHALEVSNHWGPVDVHQELPAERVEELFLYAPREQQRGEGRAPAPAAGRAPRPPPRQPREAEPRPLPALAFAGPAVATAEGRRAQRAAERAYNDAVISAAAGGREGEEALARALGASSSDADGAGGRGRGAKRKGTAKERLAKRLLTGRAVAAALADSATAERDRRRENFANSFASRE